MKTVFMQIRCTPEFREKVKRMAKRKSQGISEYIREIILREELRIKYEGEDN